MAISFKFESMQKVLFGVKVWVYAMTSEHLSQPSGSNNRRRLP